MKAKLFQSFFQTNSSKILAIGLIAFALRAAVVVLQWKYPVMNFSFYGGDSAGYDSLAQSVIAGDGLAFNGHPTAFRTPFYPLFLALMYLLCGKNFLIIGIVQSMFGALTCCLTFQSARLLFNEKTALIAGIAAALSPDLIIWTSGYILTEPIYIFLLSLVIWLSLKLLPANAESKKNTESNDAFATLTGFLFACASLTRPSFLYFSVLAIVYLGLKNGWRQFLTLTLAFLLPVSLWAVRNYSVFGEPIFTTTGGGYVLYEYHNPQTTSANGGYDPIDFHPALPAEMNELERDKFYTREALTFIKENPVKEAELTINRFWNVWRPALAEASIRNALLSWISYLPMMFFAVPMIFYLGIRTPRFGFLFLFLFYHFVFHLFVAGELRFRFPLIPVLLIYAAAGMTFALRRFPLCIDKKR